MKSPSARRMGKKSSKAVRKWSLVQSRLGVLSVCGLPGEPARTAATHVAANLAIENFIFRFGPSTHTLLSSARVYLLAQIGDKLVQRSRAEIALQAVANRNGSSFGLLAAHDQHVGDFLQLPISDLRL